MRGQAGTELTAELAMQVGNAASLCLTAPGDLAMLGYDPRESSPMLAHAVAAGIMAAGTDVEMVGVVPTPGLAFLTKASPRASVGFMISASHNPWQDNGIKLFNGAAGKLSDATEVEIEERLRRPIEYRARLGRQTDGTQHVRDYEYHLIHHQPDDRVFAGQKVALDTANGAASYRAKRIFQRLGAEVTPLFNQPDGRNINEGSGATNLTALCKTVVEEGLHWGAALDGDADRLMLVDSQGRVLDGDHILYINALGREEKKVVVATDMSNMGLERALADWGVPLLRTQVGDRYVLEALEQNGANLGGEQSGHILFRDIFPTGDGMLTAIQTIRWVRESGMSLDKWRDQLQLLPQELTSFKVADKAAFMASEAVQDVLREFEGVVDAAPGGGRINMRPSGTEQKIRVMVECEGAESIVSALMARLQQVAASLPYSH